MSRVVNEYAPDFVSPPGETLQEVLEERGMTQTQLAQRMGRPVKTINEIVKGKTAITPDTALQLERALGIPASFWNNLERRYRESLASQDERRRLECYFDWLHSIPWREMVRKGWIRKRDDTVEQIRELLNFLGVASPDAWQQVCSGVSFRRATAFESSDSAVCIWLRKGELEAQVDCSPYDAIRFRNLMPQLRALTLEDTSRWTPELVRLCASTGVAFVLVPELKGTRLCGAARWLRRDRPMIQLSLRYRTEDHFWFTFFHEAAHILLHGQRTFIDLENPDEEEAQEQEANQFSSDLLIPAADWTRFVEDLDFSSEAIARFSGQIGLSPGIVVGRLQHERRVPWNSRLNRLKRKMFLTGPGRSGE